MCFTLSQGLLTFNDKFTQIVLSVCYKLCYGQDLYLSKLSLCLFVAFSLVPRHPVPLLVTSVNLALMKGLRGISGAILLFDFYWY